MGDTDGRVDIEIDIPDAVLWQLMLAAHERDITLNHLVERILRAELDRESANEHGD